MEIEPLEFINSENSRNSTEITFVIDNAQTVLKTLNSLYIFNAKIFTLKTSLLFVPRCSWSCGDIFRYHCIYL